MHLLMNGLTVADALDPAYLDIAVDPQTSGGLLMAVPADAVTAFVADAQASGVSVTYIGSVDAGRGVALVI
jgi:selenophosphate synthase